jgi:hypothetical protein
MTDSSAARLHRRRDIAVVRCRQHAGAGGGLHLAAAAPGVKIILTPPSLCISLGILHRNCTGRCENDVNVYAQAVGGGGEEGFAAVPRPRRLRRGPLMRLRSLKD